MPANPTRRLARLAALAALALLLQGSECDKESDFFALEGEDGTGTIFDVTPPLIDNFEPSGGGVFAVDNFMFEVRDPTTSDGAEVSGLDPASVAVTNGQTFPVTLDGSMATVDLSGTPDGMHAFSIQASDLAGNPAMSSFSLNLDRTAPVVDFTSAPPSTAETDQATFEFFAAFSVSDPNFQAGVYTFLEPGSNGTCDPDDPLWPEGTGPGEVDQNAFSTPQAGSFEIRANFTNSLGPDDSPLTQTICGRYQATDTALGKAGQPNPNTFDQVFGLDITWNPPMPTTGTVTGTVTVDGSPASGVVVTLDGTRTATTDGSGTYTFDTVSQGGHTVDVTPPSGTTCDPQSQMVSVPAGGTATANFACTSQSTSQSPTTSQIQGSWTYSRSRTSTTGSCPSPLASTGTGSMTAQSMNSLAIVGLDPDQTSPLSGSYDTGTGQFMGTGSVTLTNGFQILTTVDAIFGFGSGNQVVYDDLMVREHRDSGGNVVCVENYATSGAGPVASSLRFKQSVRSLLPSGASLLGLRPVTFRYRAPYGDPAVPQIGLIAEEVVRVYPRAVVVDAAGRPTAIRYDVLTTVVVHEAGRRLVEALSGRLTTSPGMR